MTFLAFATSRWVADHSDNYHRDCRKPVVAFVELLDEGWDFGGVSYSLPWNAKEPFDVPKITLLLCCSWLRIWPVKGLLPPECRLIGTHLDSESNNLTRPSLAHEGLAVATLATLLWRRGVPLLQRTVSHLHGDERGFGPGIQPLTQHSRVSLAEVVERDGWDEAASYLVEQQQELLRQLRAAESVFAALTPRRRGRPRKLPEEWLLEHLATGARHEDILNAARREHGYGGELHDLRSSIGHLRMKRGLTAPTCR